MKQYKNISKTKDSAICVSQLKTKHLFDTTIIKELDLTAFSGCPVEELNIPDDTKII